MAISIIIPTLNEEKHIGKLIAYLLQHSGPAVSEIIVADGGSSDNTLAIAKSTGVKVLEVPRPGRAIQMNFGTAVASGNIFYFIHADSIPPPSFAADIMQAVQTGYDFGRYTTRFQNTNWLLKINAFFTRFDWFICHGGDQTLFITKELFASLKGYDASLKIMEEYDLTKRAKQQGRYKIMPKACLVSTRKYRANSWWQVQRANYTIVKMYRQGFPQEALVKRYSEMIRYR